MLSSNLDTQSPPHHQHILIHIVMPRLVDHLLDPSEFVGGKGGVVEANEDDADDVRHGVDANGNADDADNADDTDDENDGDIDDTDDDDDIDDDDDDNNDDDDNDDDEPIMAFFRRIVRNKKKNINLDSIRRRLDNPNDAAPAEETVDARDDAGRSLLGGNDSVGTADDRDHRWRELEGAGIRQ